MIIYVNCYKWRALGKGDSGTQIVISLQANARLCNFTSKTQQISKYPPLIMKGGVIDRMVKKAFLTEEPYYGIALQLRLDRHPPFQFLSKGFF